MISNKPISLEANKPIPEYVFREMEKCPFQMDYGWPKRRCVVFIPEDNAITYIDPESFDYSEVYGNCEFVQAMDHGEKRPVLIAQFEHQKNLRSFDEESHQQLTRHLNRGQNDMY